MGNVLEIYELPKLAKEENTQNSPITMKGIEFII